MYALHQHRTYVGLRMIQGGPTRARSPVSAISYGSIYSIELHANGDTLIGGTSGATFLCNLVSILFEPRGPHNCGVFREYLRGDDG